MKKLIVWICVLFVLVGCQKESPNNEITDEQYTVYNEYIKALDTHKEFTSTSEEFDIYLIVNKASGSEYRYDIIIDNPQKPMYDIQAIAKIPTEDGDVFTTIGILEVDTFSLVPNVVDKENNIYKGINLSAISSYAEVKIDVYLTFYPDEQRDTKVERFIEVTSDEIR